VLLELGPWYKDYWIVKNGLQTGDKVVVDGVNKIHKGSLVQIDQVLQDKGVD
jgi:multidrug efflux pump subunit AcrA (membrane-fusion protein)